MSMLRGGTANQSLGGAEPEMGQGSLDRGGKLKGGELGRGRKPLACSAISPPFASRSLSLPPSPEMIGSHGVLHPLSSFMMETVFRWKGG